MLRSIATVDVYKRQAEDRAGEGIFMAFQYPVEIPGVSNQFFLQTALNAVRNYRGQEALARKMCIRDRHDRCQYTPAGEQYAAARLNRGDAHQFSPIFLSCSPTCSAP